MTRPPSRNRNVRPRVYLHVGEPKTGTTYVQQLLWANQGVLAAHGVWLPGGSQQAVFRATQDLREIPKRADDPAAPWDREWSRLAREALHGPSVSVISHELLCAADDATAARAVESLRGAEVHVVLTVRDMASLLPAEWQESIKHRSTRGWDDWIDDVIDKESSVEDRRQFWFWKVHDTTALLALWARFVPRSHIHVVTVPQAASDRDLLWLRLAELLGLPPTLVDTSAVRTNASLGLAEIELLRRLNARLPSTVPDWEYMALVKEPLAHGALAGRPAGGRLELPADRRQWAADYAEQVVAHLRNGGYDVRGELSDLLPAAGSGASRHPADVTDEQLLDAGVEACAALFVNDHRRRTNPERRAGYGDVLLRLVRASPAVRTALYDLSERNSLVGGTRTLLREQIERSRAR